MTKKKSVASSQRGQLIRRSASDIRNYAESDQAQKASAQLRQHLAKHDGEPSAEDLVEIPALSEKELAAMRAAKEQLTIRLDADILQWLKSKHGPYQTRLNSILRAVMVHEQTTNAKSNRRLAGQ